MASLRLSGAALVVPLLLLLPFSCRGSSFTGATDSDHKVCPSRWCGGHNISFPFRLQDSPPRCGHPRYTLSCEEGGQLVLYLKSGKFRVHSINYNNYTIRILDASIGSDHSSSFPSYSLTSYNFSSLEPYSLLYYNRSFYSHRAIHVNYILLYLRCPHAVESCDLFVDDSDTAAATCINGSYAVGSTFYVNVGNRPLWDLGLADSCRIEWMYPTSWPTAKNNNKDNHISCTDIRNMLLYGFELSWAISACKDLSYHVHLDVYNQPQCVPLHYKAGFLGTVAHIFSILALGAPLVIVFWLYKWHRRHCSKYDATIEDFLRNDNNNIIPLRYSYKDIKRITQGFKTKLGNGAYGSVFRAQLRGGRLAAVKLLNNPKSNGQDFINEVATIGRIHHVNVVQLIGFCVEGSKRALIYELMANGSLEKYIFSNEESACLSCEILYSISLGVARGIEYLHNGCDVKILHFDIKPHNILLDENFNAKVSDFGLARLYPTDNSFVSLTAARGTIGYMAPELFYRNVGAISYKADVYSFGMLLMEIAGRRKNLNALNEHSSQIYFPFWVYDRLHDGKEIAIENVTDEEMKLAKRMMIVALWCIQTKPSDRPSMAKVVEMLEQDDEDLLQMPPKPYFNGPNDVPEEDVADHNNSTLSSKI